MKAILAYATFSQGFRVGASNGGQACTDTAFQDPNQNLCLFSPGQQFSADPADLAILDERSFEPDTTNNYELGMKATLMGGAIRLNGAIFFVEWDAPQVNTVSINAGTAITVNAETATSKGIELDGSWRVTDQFRLRGNLSYTDAQLTADVPGLIQTLTPPPGFGTRVDSGRNGDRLPGSPIGQFSVFGDYAFPLSNGDNMMLNAGYSWQSDVLSFTGGRAGSFTLPSYGRANVALGYNADNWSVTGYVDNLFNDFSETSAANTPLSNQTIAGANVRRFRTNVLAPRSIGARFKFRFQ